MFETEHYNDFSEIIKTYTLMMLSFKTSEAKEVLNIEMIDFLLDFGYDADEITSLDYDFRKSKDDDYIEIKANNLITALWFSDVYPDVIPNKDEESIVIDNIEYRLIANGKIKKIKNAK